MKNFRFYICKETKDTLSFRSLAYHHIVYYKKNNAISILVRHPGSVPHAFDSYHIILKKNTMTSVHILKLGHHYTWTWIIGLKVWCCILCDPMPDDL